MQDQASDQSGPQATDMTPWLRQTPHTELELEALFAIMQVEETPPCQADGTA